MAIIGVLANARKWRLVIYMLASAACSVYCYYDGWINKAYQTEAKAGDRLFNQVGAIVLGVLFVILIVRFFLALKTRVVVDESGMDVNGKFKIAWPSIIRVDDRNLEKGLLDIFYKGTEGGSEKKYVLDNYKVTSFDEMVEEISRHRPDILAPVEEEGK